RRMIDNEVDQDPNSTLLGSVGKLDEIPKRAVSRIDAVVVGDVIAAVAPWRALERHEPDRRDAKSMQIVKAPHQALEIADAIAVRVHIGRNREAVDDSVLIPKVLDHARAGEASAS